MMEATWFVVSLSAFIVVCIIWGLVMLVCDLQRTVTDLWDLLDEHGINVYTRTKRKRD